MNFIFVTTDRWSPDTYRWLSDHAAGKRACPHERVNHKNVACFVLRRIHVTGALDAHDVEIGADGRAIFVNTRLPVLAARR